MEIIIREVENQKDLKKFINFPLNLYKNSPYYVPAMFSDECNTLRKDKNPAFEYCEARYWLALKHGKVVGRVAAILNKRHIEKWGQKYLRFGWLDFIDDPEVLQALLDVVENWARQLNLEAVHGPLGFTNLDREGMLVKGFNEVATMATIYNYSYYPDYMQQLGYTKDVDYVEYEIKVPPITDPKFHKISEVVQKRHNLTLLRVEHKKDLLQYAQQLFELINHEYNHIYGTTILTQEQIKKYINQYFGFVDPDFVPVVLDENRKMVAFGVTIPSLSSALQKSHGKLLPFGWFHILRALKKNEKADLYLVAVKKSYQGLGVNTILMDQIIKVFNQRGIYLAESNPELETNLNVQSQWKFFDKRQHKRRRCFIKYLN